MTDDPAHAVPPEDPPIDLDDEKRQKFAETAMTSDRATQAVLDTLLELYPESEDALVSGAMTAVVRFGLQRQHEAAKKWVAQGQIGRAVTVREAFGYFAKFVQQAAELLLGKPGKTDA